MVLLLQNTNNFTDVSFEIKVTGGGSGGSIDHTTKNDTMYLDNVKIYGKYLMSKMTQKLDKELLGDNNNNIGFCRI